MNSSIPPSYSIHSFNSFTQHYLSLYIHPSLCASVHPSLNVLLYLLNFLLYIHHFHPSVQPYMFIHLSLSMLHLSSYFSIYSKITPFINFIFICTSNWPIVHQLSPNPSIYLFIFHASITFIPLYIHLPVYFYNRTSLHLANSIISSTYPSLLHTMALSWHPSLLQSVCESISLSSLSSTVSTVQLCVFAINPFISPFINPLIHALLHSSILHLLFHLSSCPSCVCLWPLCLYIPPSL